MTGAPEATLSRHVPALDGVRGLAILTVFLFHVAAYAWTGPTTGLDRVMHRVMEAGWIGVDLFFVLSGYLITGILVSSRGTPRYFRNFYIRRALRIFPLFYLSLLLFALAAQWYPQFRPASLEAALANWTYTSNIYMAVHGWDVEPTVMQPFWSLAVEEQFYFVWPLVVYAARGSRLMTVSIAGILLSIFVRAFLLASGHDLAAYMLLPARMDSLLAGSLVGLILGWGAPSRPSWMRRRPGLKIVAAAASIAMIVVLRMFLWDSVAVQALKSTLIALGFAVLLAASLLSTRSGALSGFFTAAPLRFLGRYSYSIYIFHAAVITTLARQVSVRDLPVIFGSRIPAAIFFTIVSVGVTILIALATWHLVEKHFLRMKDRFAKGRGGEAVPDQSFPNPPSVEVRAVMGE
ncbi:MAG: acyltransferase [Gemmatimonadales bacterium]